MTLFFKLLDAAVRSPSEFSDITYRDLYDFNNLNNSGSQIYIGELDKIGNYKFSKWENERLFNFKPVFLSDGIIFFDKKGTIIRFDENQKVIWKKNHYSKSEKKLQPKLNFLLDEENLLITDNIAKYYSININTGEFGLELS